jgi:hypothetical protein
MSANPTQIYSDTTPDLPQEVKVEKILLEWTSPSRPYKKRTREFYTTIGSIVFLISIILLLMNEILLIGVIISFAFLSYVLASHKPGDTTHQLTTKGIRTDGKLYSWDIIHSFWLKKEWDQELITCRLRNTMPGLIMLVIDEKNRAEIIKQIGEKVELIKPTDTFVDKASRWLGDKIPLENR